MQEMNMVNNPTFSSSSTSCSNPSNLIETNDVFLSFGGGNDTITGDLHAGLCREHIKSYFDKESHERSSSDEIGSQLMRVIQSSKMAIIVLSQNYVSSKWCLNELVHTLQCREINRQIVVPIFLKTPSSSSESYDTAFSQLKNRFKGRMDNKVQAWSAALKVITSLSGWDSCGIRPESKLVKMIIDDVLQMRIPLNLNVSIYPLRHDVFHEYVSILGSDDVVMVGIVGEAKMGKMMMAKAIYDGLVEAFDGGSFLIGVGKKSKEPNGMVQLQEKLLFDILGEKISLASETQGVTAIRERLCQKKVLIVLDDVDDLSQLLALVGRRKWFGLGSKIIITSTDLPLLCIFEVDQLFLAQGLPLPFDIQEICEPFQQSCPKIPGLKEYIKRLPYLTYKKVKYLEECRTRERRNGTIQYGQEDRQAFNSCTKLEEVGTPSSVAMSSSFVESSPKSLLRSLSSDSENKGLNETITDSNPDIGQVSHNDVDTNAVAVDHEEVEEVMSVDNSRNTPKESNGTFSHVLCCFCLK
ncbi:disease resistance protein RPV1-like isoform X1 [Cannabis sativa]|uniref:disease resistance protein RPV1-like isoform X1 n=2 Tax=Cannabis sativa TaxID=3483 RepID=UPI0029CA223D|nr:disease resistance protein RPV1-like isoform X1 [Cannabis sativa]